MSSPRRSRSPGYRSPSPRRRSPSPRRRDRGDRDRGDRDRRRRYSRSPPRYRTRSPIPRRRDYGSDKDLKNSCTLFIGNLPYHFRERDIAEYLERSGRIRNVTVGYNKRTGQSKGHAFVEYEDRRDAEDAFERFQGYNIEGRRLRIDWDIGLDRKREFEKTEGGDGVTTGPAARRGSPRRGSRSPKRSTSPRKRSPSPRRSNSPKRSPSPRKGSQSPARKNGSPSNTDRKRSRSPEAKESPRDDKKQKTED